MASKQNFQIWKEFLSKFSKSQNPGLKFLALNPLGLPFFLTTPTKGIGTPSPAKPQISWPTNLHVSPYAPLLASRFYLTCWCITSTLLEFLLSIAAVKLGAYLQFTFYDLDVIWGRLDIWVLSYCFGILFCYYQPIFSYRNFHFFLLVILFFFSCIHKMTRGYLLLPALTTLHFKLVP